MKLSRRSLLTAAVVVAATAGGGWYLLRPAAVESGVVFADNGVAIRGYDPVAYFTSDAPTPGDPAITAEHGGATWRFASTANRDLFLADPTRYTPQYGGFCAWGVAEKGQAFPTDPTAWKIVDGKLYLNYDHEVQTKWLADTPGFIKTGETKWPDIKRSLAKGS